MPVLGWVLLLSNIHEKVVVVARQHGFLDSKLIIVFSWFILYR